MLSHSEMADCLYILRLSIPIDSKANTDFKISTYLQEIESQSNDVQYQVLTIAAKLIEAKDRSKTFSLLYTLIELRAEFTDKPILQAIDEFILQYIKRSTELNAIFAIKEGNNSTSLSFDFAQKIHAVTFFADILIENVIVNYLIETTQASSIALSNVPIVYFPNLLPTLFNNQNLQRLELKTNCLLNNSELPNLINLVINKTTLLGLHIYLTSEENVDSQIYKLLSLKPELLELSVIIDDIPETNYSYLLSERNKILHSCGDVNFIINADNEQRTKLIEVCFYYTQLEETFTNFFTQDVNIVDDNLYIKIKNVLLPIEKSAAEKELYLTVCHQLKTIKQQIEHWHAKLDTNNFNLITIGKQLALFAEAMFPGCDQDLLAFYHPLYNYYRDLLFVSHRSHVLTVNLKTYYETCLPIMKEAIYYFTRLSQKIVPTSQARTPNLLIFGIYHLVSHIIDNYLQEEVDAAGPKELAKFYITIWNNHVLNKKNSKLYNVASNQVIANTSFQNSYFDYGIYSGLANLVINSLIELSKETANIPFIENQSISIPKEIDSKRKQLEATINNIILLAMRNNDYFFKINTINALRIYLTSYSVKSKILLRLLNETNYAIFQIQKQIFNEISANLKQLTHLQHFGISLCFLVNNIHIENMEILKFIQEHKEKTVSDDIIVCKSYYEKLFKLIKEMKYEFENMLLLDDNLTKKYTSYFYLNVDLIASYPSISLRNNYLTFLMHRILVTLFSILKNVISTLRTKFFHDVASDGYYLLMQAYEAKLLIDERRLKFYNALPAELKKIILAESTIPTLMQSLATELAESTLFVKALKDKYLCYQTELASKQKIANEQKGKKEKEVNEWLEATSLEEELVSRKKLITAHKTKKVVSPVNKATGQYNLKPINLMIDKDSTDSELTATVIKSDRELFYELASKQDVEAAVNIAHNAVASLNKDDRLTHAQWLADIANLYQSQLNLTNEAATTDNAYYLKLAIQHYEQALTICYNSDDAELYSLASFIETEYQQLASLNSTRAIHHKLLDLQNADNAYYNYQFQIAFNIYKNLYEEGDTRFAVILRLAKCYERIALVEEAIQHLKYYLQHNNLNYSEYLEVTLQLCNFLLKKNQLKEAKFYLDILQQNKHPAWQRTNLKYLYQAGDSLQVQMQLEKLEKYKRITPSNLFLLAQYYFYLSNVKKAKKYFLKLYQFVPEHLYYQNRYAIFLIKTGNLHEAQQLIKHLLTLSPSYLPCKITLAELCIKLHKKTDALQILDPINEEYPAYLPGFIEKIKYYKSFGEQQKLNQLLDELIVTYPQNLQINNYYLKWHSDQEDKAIQKILVNHPELANHNLQPIMSLPLDNQDAGEIWLRGIISEAFALLKERQQGDFYLVGGTVISLLDKDNIAKRVPDLDFVGICDNVITLINKGFQTSKFINALYTYVHEQFHIDLIVKPLQKNWIAFDAQKRDFTICALYCDAKFNIYDPSGKGFRDLEAKILRTVGPALECLKDPICVLRALAYMLKGFSPDKELEHALKNFKLTQYDRNHLLAVLAKYFKYSNKEEYVKCALKYNGLLKKLFDLNTNDILTAMNQLEQLLNQQNQLKMMAANMRFFTKETNSKNATNQATHLHEINVTVRGNTS